MKLTFLGAAQTVTGSKYLLEIKNKKILVDCGLFQGYKESQRNWENFPIAAQNIDAIILTHAHIDHSGYIPVLVKNGFRGEIFCSSATFDLCKILLSDSGFIQEEDARHANRAGYSKHQPALPLYTAQDAEKSFQYFSPIEFGQPQYFDDNFYFTLSRAGHILGSAFVSIFFENKSIVFSGDLGRHDDPIVKSPAQIQYADYLVIESTYGNRLHEKTDPQEILKNIIIDTAARGGVVLIPAFAVGRAQIFMYYIYELKRKNLIPDLPVFLDSPMAIDASDILNKHTNEHKLGKDLCKKICQIAHYVRTAEESKALNQIKVPMIIISASGMAEGGRVKHHLKNYISDHKNAILFGGFQVEGTLGNKIVRGDKTVRIHGVYFDVNAEIFNMNNSSAHADYEEILDWLGNFKKDPKKTFITHGNLEAANSLKEKIKQKFGWQASVPAYLQSEEL